MPEAGYSRTITTRQCVTAICPTTLQQLFRALAQGTRIGHRSTTLPVVVQWVGSLAGKTVLPLIKTMNSGSTSNVGPVNTTVPSDLIHSGPETCTSIDRPVISDVKVSSTWPATCVAPLCGPATNVR